MIFNKGTALAYTPSLLSHGGKGLIITISIIYDQVFGFLMVALRELIIIINSLKATRGLPVFVINRFSLNC